mgnify:CR=1 FL=1
MGGSTVGLQWVYSGSIVGLQWVYSGSTVGLWWVYSGLRMNKRQIQNKDIMEVKKRLLEAFNFAKNTKSMTSDSVAKAPEPPKGDKL